MRVVLGTLAAALALAAPAGAAESFYDILPPGTAGTYNVAQLGAFLATGARPTPNTVNQRPMYGDLVYATPGLQREDLEKYFKRSSFGVRADQIARSYSPRPDVRIERDAAFGVPVITGTTRDGAMFGAGYVAAEDRLFFMDVLRNAGRAQLAAFAGGANIAMDRDTWATSPYTEEELQRQVDQLDDLYGADGARVQRDVEQYVMGVNAYIDETRLDISKLPGEYAALGYTAGPERWKTTDVIATASLVGGIFGKGDGNELDWAQLRPLLTTRFGGRLGKRILYDLRAADDPEAPTTVTGGRRFPYQLVPKHIRRGTEAVPDPGSVKPHQVVEARSGGGRRATTPLLRPRGFPRAASNALIVGAGKSESGHPLAVFGPQVGYFTPEILMESEIHAPDIAARGASFIGVNLYIQLGHGVDYAWSATSAGQDNIDTFALPLCDPGGGAASIESTGYVFRGRCEPIEVLRRTDAWTASVGDSTPSGSETLRAERTKLGIVQARATIKGKPYLYVRLRSTYMHEVDSALGFKDFNDPAKMRDARDFQRAANRIGYTFNWLYVDDRDFAYFNSGAMPRRPKGLNPTLPLMAKPQTEWRGWDPATNVAAYVPFSGHAQAIDGQDFMVSWNNRQAAGVGGAGTNLFSSLFRSDMLVDQIRPRIAGADKMSLPELIDAMEVAGVTDLRGARVLPWALRVLGTPSDPALADAVAKLRAWAQAGAPRKDADRDGRYDHSEAIQIMDAWWPRWLRAQFEPVLGEAAFERLRRISEFDNEPYNHGDHLGSAYQTGWYGYAQKDLRTVLKRPVRGRYARKFCGRGSLKHCRAALAASLKEALAVKATDLYKGSGCAAGDQLCHDEVRFRATGGATQEPIHWINRPTYQQAVEVQSHRPR